MTEDELQLLVEDVSWTSFKKPFTHQAFFNARLRTTGGRYHVKDHHLDFNPKMATLKREIFIGIIKHELCHYHLHIENKGYQHKDTDFKELLTKTGGLRYAPDIQTKRKFHVYQCQSCQLLITRQKKMDTHRFVCGKCGGSLYYKSTYTKNNLE
ncbi:SprT family protein [Tetragenococcus osmophilus]|uniref:Protein SprT n=1 Tax=Tetragenococcus osmophilus TaxID=526944 RepID=A0AA38CW22_9ENTE|nr:SprT family protein [Tetragenococcus osmophilus]AYW48688.1 SprT family protein [Tetragenococcus osmophilus]GMA54642.1 protein SprT [Alicyclobacillus contaminans]GMA71531.1 protein SprT [Tetragenococcus osmophilus]